MLILRLWSRYCRNEILSALNAPRSFEYQGANMHNHCVDRMQVFHIKECFVRESIITGVLKALCMRLKKVMYVLGVGKKIWLQMELNKKKVHGIILPFLLLIYILSIRLMIFSFRISCFFFIQILKTCSEICDLLRQDLFKKCSALVKKSAIGPKALT